MSALRYTFTLACFAALFFWMPHAHAACSASGLPYTVSPGTVKIPATLAIGNAIPGSTQSRTLKGSCDDQQRGQPVIACYTGEGEEVPGMPGVYQTSIDGVGIEMLNSAGQPIRGSGAHCDSRSTPLGFVSQDGTNSFNVSLTLQLIKTASHIGHQAFNTRYSSWSIGVYPDQQLGALNAVTYTGNVTLQATTCSVDPKSLTVTLGDFPLTQFNGPGSYTNWKSFNLSTTCTDMVQMTARVTSANGSTNISDGVDALNLTPGSDSATGVGVRMLIGGVVLRYDYPIPFGDSTVANQPFNMLFQVQYYQLAAQVTPGKANTVATIDIEYR